ncbi:hypothetical protein [Alteromonas facilis]|uniref:hypothetical protein n=1 Tax=Alteromonas facilis TaxID=2048004 RepID=UPI000C28BA0A|nr:hypothetical protein [Alteromonas facilis]
MKFSKHIASTLVISSCLFAPIASAQEGVVQTMVSRMLSSVVELTVDELQNQAAEAVANTAHQFSDKADEVQTQVKVTELTAVKSQKQELPESE